MNFWCFHPSIFGVIEGLFQEFVKANYKDIKSEFFIPIVGDAFVKNGGGVIKVIPTSSQWFGVTYKEDAPVVKESVDTLVNNKEYPASLWRQLILPKCKWAADKDQQPILLFSFGGLKKLS